MTDDLRALLEEAADWLKSYGIADTMPIMMRLRAAAAETPEKQDGQYRIVPDGVRFAITKNGKMLINDLASDQADRMCVVMNGWLIAPVAAASGPGVDVAGPQMTDEEIERRYATLLLARAADAWEREHPAGRGGKP